MTDLCKSKLDKTSSIRQNRKASSASFQTLLRSWWWLCRLRCCVECAAKLRRTDLEAVPCRTVMCLGRLHARFALPKPLQRQGCRTAPNSYCCEIFWCYDLEIVLRYSVYLYLAGNLISRPRRDRISGGLVGQVDGCAPPPPSPPTIDFFSVGFVRAWKLFFLPFWEVLLAC